MKKFTKRDFLVFGTSIILVIFAIYENQTIQAQNQIYFPRPLTSDDLKLYSNTDPNAVVIYPIFTQYAYEKGGFYDYFNGTCNKCSTVSINPLIINASYVTGLKSFDNLLQLHYPFITDKMVDQHPEILNNYDKIILLHNEYMTKNEFNAIKNHKNVFYLYPNAMYVEISVDYNTKTISLVRGHSYPDKTIGNGFGYITSSKGEYDLKCQNYKWESMPNGIQPTCWPEFLIQSDRSVLQVIKDFPNTLPPLVVEPHKNINMSKMCYYDQYGNCTQKFGS